MPFQFLCPQGHLLEGNESDMGLECQCPQCGTAFIIPTLDRPGAPAAAPAPQVPPSQVPPSQGAPSAYQRPKAGRDQAFAALEAAAESTAPKKPARLDEELLENVEGAAAEEALLHIPCPNGHELETPYDMLGQRAMCPQCGAEFKLKREKSVEYQREQDILEGRRAKFWFQLAVWAAGFVVVIILAMIAIVAVT
jgi:hypothetical protein